MAMTASTTKKMPKPRMSGEKTQNHDREASPHDAPAIPANLKTSNTTNVSPNTPIPVLLLDDEDELELIVLPFVRCERWDSNPQ